mgnify:CR=1 FL=1
MGDWLGTACWYWAGWRNHPDGAAVLRSTHSTSGDVRGGELLRELRLGRLRHSAALNRPGEVVSRCEQSKETLRLTVGLDGPEPSELVVPL